MKNAPNVFVETTLVNVSTSKSPGDEPFMKLLMSAVRTEMDTGMRAETEGTAKAKIGDDKGAEK